MPGRCFPRSKAVQALSCPLIASSAVIRNMFNHTPVPPTYAFIPCAGKPWFYFTSHTKRNNSITKANKLSLFRKIKPGMKQGSYIHHVRKNKELITVTAGSTYSNLYVWRINRQNILFIIIYHKIRRQNIGTPGGHTTEQNLGFVW
jgi:hypothetical protein